MRNIMNVLSLTRRAGVEIMFLNYLKFIKAKAPHLLIHHVVFVLNINDYFRNELDNLKIKYYVAQRKNKYDLNVLRQMRFIVKKHNIDIVYSQNFTSNFLASLSILGMRNKILICHEHGTSWNAKGLITLCTYFWLFRASLIICNSKATKSILSKRFKVPLDKLKVIYNGVPKNRLLNKEKKKVLLFVGRLEEVKDPETVIRAMPYVLNKDPQVSLVILGEGSMRLYLIELAKKLGIHHEVAFKGNVEDVSEYMSEASILILPSIRESLGNVVIEAAFQNTPTVAAKVDGLSEVIKHNETGLLIKPEIEIKNRTSPKFVVDPDSKKLTNPKKIRPELLSSNIIELLNSNKFVEMGMKANMYVSNKFSLEKYYKNLQKTLDEI